MLTSSPHSHMWSSSCALLTMRSARCSRSSSRRELARREIERLAADLARLLPIWSYVSPPYSTSDGLTAGAAACERAHARFQLLQRERLGQIVVGAQVEPAHAVLDAVLRGENQHGQLAAPAAQALQHLESAHLRQADVQDEQVEFEARRSRNRPRRRWRRSPPSAPNRAGSARRPSARVGSSSAIRIRIRRVLSSRPPSPSARSCAQARNVASSLAKCATAVRTHGLVRPMAPRNSLAIRSVRHSRKPMADTTRYAKTEKGTAEIRSRGQSSARPAAHDADPDRSVEDGRRAARERRPDRRASRTSWTRCVRDGYVAAVAGSETPHRAARLRPRAW